MTDYCRCEHPLIDVEHDAGCRRCGLPVDFTPQPASLDANREHARAYWREIAEQRAELRRLRGDLEPTTETELPPMTTPETIRLEAERAADEMIAADFGDLDISDRDRELMRATYCTGWIDGRLHEIAGTRAMIRRLLTGAS